MGIIVNSQRLQQYASILSQLLSSRITVLVYLVEPNFVILEANAYPRLDQLLEFPPCSP